MTTYLEFAARGKYAWWRYAACVIAGCLATVVIFAAVLLPLSIAHVLPRNFATEIQQPTNPVVFFGAVALTFGSLLAGFVLAIRVIHRKRIRDVMGSWSWTMFIRGACIWAILQCAATLIDFLIAPHSFRLSMNAETAILAIVAFGGLSIQTFCEEFVFRGYVTQGILLATKRPVLAALLSGSLFGALHIWNGAPQAVGALFFGIVCSLIAIRTGSIAFTFGMHFVNNYAGAVAVVSTGDIFKNSPGILLQNAPQLMWWDIGVSVVGLAIVLLMVRRRGGAFAWPSWGVLGREA